MLNCHRQTASKDNFTKSSLYHLLQNFKSNHNQSISCRPKISYGELLVADLCISKIAHQHKSFKTIFKRKQRNKKTPKNEIIPNSQKGKIGYKRAFKGNSRKSPQGIQHECLESLILPLWEYKCFLTSSRDKKIRWLNWEVVFVV